MLQLHLTSCVPHDSYAVCSTVRGRQHNAYSLNQQPSGLRIYLCLAVLADAEEGAVSRKLLQHQGLLGSISEDAVTSWRFILNASNDHHIHIRQLLLLPEVRKSRVCHSTTLRGYTLYTCCAAVRLRRLSLVLCSFSWPIVCQGAHNGP